MKTASTWLEQTLKSLNEFIRMESFAGILLVAISGITLIIANSSLHLWYSALIGVKLSVGFNSYQLTKPLLLWINDGLMAIYFLLIGLELKREVLEGQLSKASQVILPGAAALGGIIVPALIFTLFNHQDPIAMKGWAIPVATDIAFALGVLTILGKKVPHGLKILLMTIAIFDDIFAIAIIAIYYTTSLSLSSCLFAIAAIFALILLNRFNIAKISIYLMVGVLLWFFVLKSGVHATLAGVILAFTIPLRVDDKMDSPLKRMETKLHPWVIYLIIPLFAFANAGIYFGDVKSEDLLNPVTIGIALALFLGKPLGIFSTCYVLIKAKFAHLPTHTHWFHLLGISFLAGIGFTMSLFISALAFESTQQAFALLSRIGILAGSVASAIIGYITIKLTNCLIFSTKI